MKTRIRLPHSLGASSAECGYGKINAREMSRKLSERLKRTDPEFARESLKAAIRARKGRA